MLVYDPLAAQENPCNFSFGPSTKIFAPLWCRETCSLTIFNTGNTVISNTSDDYARFDVFTAGKIQVEVFWVVHIIKRCYNPEDLDLRNDD